MQIADWAVNLAGNQMIAIVLLCRSIDYIGFAEECSISYFTKDDHPVDFVQDKSAIYNQWICESNENLPGKWATIMPYHPPVWGGDLAP